MHDKCNGESGKNFRNICNGKENTLTIVKSEYEKIFGGFRKIAFTKNNSYYEDRSAFLFSLSHEVKIE